MAGGDVRASTRVLTCRADGKICALPIAHVLETMRPLPVRPLADLPPFVLGLALIRGWPTPVVDARTLLGGSGARPAGRYVTLRLATDDARRVAALAVDAVLGVADLEEQALGELPALLKTTRGELIRALGSLDSELLLVLEHSRVLPPEFWPQLGTSEVHA
ncbi:MAG TPA: chemotaxis protein CheW [Polyangiaceae bacterium]|nr:chemotaxis protein CheW [Polyangiaceae bacterium]